MPQILSERLSIIRSEEIYIKFSNPVADLAREFEVICDPETGDTHEVHAPPVEQDTAQRFRQAHKRLATVQERAVSALEKHFALDSVLSYSLPVGIIHRLKKFEGNIERAEDNRRKDFEIFSFRFPMILGGTVFLWGIATFRSIWWAEILEIIAK